MKLNKVLILCIVLSFIATIFAYFRLPDVIPRHWNFEGVADSMGNKKGVFITGLMPAIVYLMMIFMPKIDPKKESYKKHEKAYEIFAICITFVLIALHWISILAAINPAINVGVFTRILIALMFIIMGNYMSQIRFNYFFGIRTPWTLANEEVWTKTHRVGAYGFSLVGIIMLLSLFLPGQIAFTIFMATTIIYIVGIMGYSYLEYRKVSK